jgi:dTDP-4-amino-4,6-dideoxygalactose transaminase
MSPKIPFNLPYLSGREKEYVVDAIQSREHCGNRTYSQKCIQKLEADFQFQKVFLTTSCTTAMEMGAILANLKPGDEVIMPSYTFSSTGNAVLLQGASPVFAEIEPNTMNLDVNKIESLISPRTKMILPIDYAGIPCEIDKIMEIANRHDLLVMQDAAQSFHSSHNEKPCGSVAHLAAFSFHESKNISCGEGGALVVNRPEWNERASFIQEKGTDRSLVLKGIKNKYNWVEKGSSFLLSDILAAMLLAQLEAAETIMNLRSKVTEAYLKLLRPHSNKGLIRILNPSSHAKLNHHAFFVIFNTEKHKEYFLTHLLGKNIHAYIGYLPLHSSPIGKKLGYKPDDLPITEDLASRIVRLPFYTNLSSQGLDYCLNGIQSALKKIQYL